MSKQRTVRLEPGRPNQVIYVLGTELNIDIYKPAPLGSQSFEVHSSPDVKCSISDLHNVIVAAEHAKRWAINNGTLLVVTMEKTSNYLNDNKVTIIFYGDKLDKPIDKIILQLTAVYISLDVDADRDGEVEKNNPNKGSWAWGPKGHGAVLLVNCDKDMPQTAESDRSDDTVHTFGDLHDMSPMILRTEGPNSLPSDYKLQLYISASDANKVQVFRHDLTKMTKVLGRTKLSAVMEYTKGNNEYQFFIEGLVFADEGNSNMVTINLSLLEPMIVGDAPIFTEHVVFHLAPWIMTPNTLAPQEVFVCSVMDNAKFLKEFAVVVEKAKCKLTVCTKDMNRKDRWIQDEIEFGYSEAPHKTFPVVLDSPRDRGLSMFPYKQLLGPDFGHVTRTTNLVSSLDSFGNLEVSPPVTMNGKEYPLGRIIIGSAFPTTSEGRNMAKVVRDFLYAQVVQPPIELFSDWLEVGHVDEFMTFVPAPDRKGFRLLLVSPDACCKLFTKLQQEGHGEAQMFENLNTKPFKINEILNNQKLLRDNAYVQRCIDWNRDVLKKELGLDEEDIIDIPVLFMMHEKYQKAIAFFPDLVNMIVLGKYLGIPKPFGPLINGKCPLESAVRSALEPLGLECNFIDDFVSYHMKAGEVHCGSNVRRKPFALKWWNMEM
ncbi:protein-arginine deiminase type-2-like [Carcharodon carcharias]|uniref:protein-arginine deiminase type-2-like n=1 Tax=Carcharodon carcharias TaxID=13397 RepID=UPI001B7F75D5|nr:protein-arginine deiminase type-2-like [Carcharodon carcharias]XP_041063345.1 protein-arginine deiminase type-2-like [Carcharodon carcharias]XP_041063346.1 protein-arginine deiminase type-2-like [Carcharodon carcharias]XP_041063347.1 protein-arginine deiminase type-2-like [Carcharodon carcharias]